MNRIDHTSGQSPTRVWGLSDFHLNYDSLPRELTFVNSSNEPTWLKNARKIAKNWSECVGPNDIVLIPGDLSAAKTHSDVQRDLAWLLKRPASRVAISPGNHDHWFGRLAGVNRILRNNQLGIDGNAVDLGPLIVCGARSTPTPDDPLSEPPRSGTAESIAFNKLQNALLEAQNLHPVNGPAKPIFVLWHHPPFDRWGRPDRVVELMRSFSVKACLYGHLHTQLQWQSAPQGLIDGVEFYCVASDSLAFRPRLIADLS
ncbi:MAG: hypothetical protein RJA81_1324 [Planctomycetota bacterium]|jgi:predicted phosphohydrolase